MDVMKGNDVDVHEINRNRNITLNEYVEEYDPKMLVSNFKRIRPTTS
jgi:hypothetical protein